MTITQDAKLEVYRSSLAMSLGGEVSVTEEISLESELINSLYRRGRRRLRDIQSNCGVNVWLDKLRGVLHLSGSKASVAAAKNLIAGLGGPRKQVSTAMWAELLRTRKLQSGTEAAVARIQQESGCRIHVERGSQEVHLFGDSESVAIAEKLLKELDQNCVEEAITPGADPIHPTTLQALANQYDVTVHTDKGIVCMLGLRENVEKAVGVFREHRDDLESYLDIPAPIVSVSVDAQDSTKIAEVVPDTSKAIPNNGVKFTSNVVPKNENKNMSNICPTCNACPFCAKCGHPTAFIDSANASGFAAIGNIAYGNQIFINSDYNFQAGSGMWQQLPFMPYDYGSGGGVVDNTTPMAFMIPSPQNVPVCFVPAAMVPAHCQ